MARENPFAVDPFQSPNPPLFGSEVSEAGTRDFPVVLWGPSQHYKTPAGVPMRSPTSTFTTSNDGVLLQNGHSNTVASVPEGETDSTTALQK